ncbi:MAG: fibronectin type III domain-containing protein [Eubacterium sp.]|nr:fibronectin type III domain-containing protein [Eubacterium sp.]
MSKKILSLLLTLVIVFIAISPVSYAVSAATYAQSLRDKGFPKSYVTILTKLHSKYPNWKFEPFKTGLDWQTAINGERKARHGQQSIQKLSTRSNAYYCKCSNCYSGGYYHVTESPNWVAASEAAVKYYMDARNWLTPKYIFQFESIDYDSSAKQAGVESILNGSFMHNAYITYKNANGDTVTYKNSSGNKVKYSQAFIQAGKNANMNPYFLASKVKLEIGSYDASLAGGSSGTKEPFRAIYNYYSIGATANATMGLEWANGYLRTSKATTMYSKYNTSTKKVSGTKTNLKASQYFAYRGTYGDYYKGKLYSTIYDTSGKVGYIKKSDVRTKYLTYNRPWSNPYRSIYGGASYLRNTFGKYQFNDYLQKFNVNKNSGCLYACEYSITVNAPAKASETTYAAYRDAGILAESHTFYIPVFKNMPAKNCIVDGTASEVTSDTSMSDSTTSTTSSTANMVTALKITKRTQNSLSFKWKKYPGATKYYMYIKNQTKGTHFDKTVTTNSGTIRGLNPGNKYSVRVKAYTSKGWTKYSKYNTKHTTPPKASGLKRRSAPTAAGVSLKWNKVNGVTGYKVYTYNKKKNTYRIVGYFSTNSGTVKLTSGKTHTVCVTAYVKDGKVVTTGGISNKITVTTKPASVKLKSVTSPAPGKIKVSWNKVTGGESGYQIIWAKDSKFKNKIATTNIKGKATTSYTGQNFTKGHTYYIKMRTYKKTSNKKVYGKWSATKKVVSK